MTTFDAESARRVAIPAGRVTVERGRVAFFARTIGEAEGVHTDVELARAAGHRDVVAPPTFLFTVLNELPDAFGDLSLLGVDLGDVLHGEQAFTYHSPVHAGDVLDVAPRLVDAYSKKGGALRFLVRETEVRRDGELVATERATLVIPTRERT